MDNVDGEVLKLLGVLGIGSFALTYAIFVIGSKKARPSMLILQSLGLVIATWAYFKYLVQPMADIIAQEQAASILDIIRG